MNFVLYKHHIFTNALCCDSRIKPIHDKFQKPFLEIDVKGGDRDHIKAYHLERYHIREYHFHRGRKYSSRKYFSRIPDAWCSRGEMPHVFLGERHVHMCLFASALFICFFELWFCSDFLFPIFSQYPMLDSGGARHLREGNPWIHSHIYLWGHVYIHWGT